MIESWSSFKICKLTYENKKVVEIFDYFIERNAKISLVNTYGHTALHTVAAKSNDNLDLVKRILDLCKLFPVQQQLVELVFEP